MVSKSRFRSGIIFLLVLITNVCLFGTGLFTDNLKNGSQKLHGRTYADLLVVPESYLDNTKDLLFKGKACTIIFKDDVLSEIKNIKGAEAVSPQLYVETLALSCCSEEGMQVIAIDPSSDFAVSQWSDGVKELSGNKALAGSGGNLRKGDTINLFGREFSVSGILEETGMGYDNSIFISYEAANEITSSEQYRFMFGQKAGLVSMFLVKRSSDVELSELTRSISSILEESDAKVYPIDDLSADLRDHVDLLSKLITIISVFTVTVASVALFAMVTLNFHQRSRIAGSMLSVGFSRGKILECFFSEYIFLFGTGALSGIALICVFMLPLHEELKAALHMPYKLISGTDALKLAAKTLLTDLVMLLAAVSFTFTGIIKKEPALLMEEQA